MALLALALAPRTAALALVLLALLALLAARASEPAFPGPIVVVSLTTSPTRIGHIGPLLRSLSRQTRAPDRVVLNLPRVFARTGARFGAMPAFVSNNPLVLVNWVDDAGPASKVVPTAALVDDPDATIISVDDDIEYKPTMVESMLAVSARYPGAVVTGQSFRAVPGGVYAELVEGYSSVLYRRWHLDGLSCDAIRAMPRACYLADDLVISRFLAARGIPIVRAAALGVVPFGAIYLEHGERADALKHGADGTSLGNLDNYEKCTRFLDERG
jgi:hypothetical protein